MFYFFWLPCFLRFFNVLFMLPLHKCLGQRLAWFPCLIWQYWKKIAFVFREDFVECDLRRVAWWMWPEACGRRPEACVMMHVTWGMMHVAWCLWHDACGMIHDACVLRHVTWGMCPEACVLMHVLRLCTSIKLVIGFYSWIKGSNFKIIYL